MCYLWWVSNFSDKARNQTYFLGRNFVSDKTLIDLWKKKLFYILLFQVFLSYWLSKSETKFVGKGPHGQGKEIFGDSKNNPNPANIKYRRILQFIVFISGERRIKWGDSILCLAIVMLASLQSIWISNRTILLSSHVGPLVINPNLPDLESRWRGFTFARSISVTKG